jgi:hypothetical protein
MMGKEWAKGQRVRWNWGTGVAYGKIVERFDRHVERTINGAKVSRNGSADNPAYLVALEDGGEALKLGSELDGA